MLANIARTAVVATFFALSLSEARAAEPPIPIPSGQSVAVLRNGEVIVGKITRSDDLYLVELPHGRIRLKQADVELVCGSLEEGYQRKRAVIHVGNVHDHLGLAQWCLRHNLLGFAAVELADAKVADPTNQMIGVLQRRLKTAMEPPPTPETKKPALASGPSNAELDQMIRETPRGVVETFTQSVQPVLLRNCANPGCHSLNSETALQLYRIPTGRSSSRRTTQRNLYSALQFIDRANPSASKLLTAGKGPHGTAKNAIFNELQASQFQHLINWANQVAGQPKMSETPASVARRGPAKVVEPPNDETLPKLLPEDSGKTHLLTASARRRPAGVRRPGTADGDATPATFDQPANPLDPAAFNQRHAPEKPKSSELPKKSPESESLWPSEK